MRCLALLSIAALAACSDPVDEALAAYEKADTPLERCLIAGDVSDAYLSKGKASDGAVWRAVANSDCVVVRAHQLPTDEEVRREVEDRIDGVLLVD